MLNCININATSLPDAWFQAVYRLLEIGRDFKIDRGSFEGDKRLEYDWFSCYIKNPGYPKDRISYDQLLPHLPGHYNIPNPVESGYVEEYLPYIMTGEVKDGESYTYGSRICKHTFDINCLRNNVSEENFNNDIILKEFNDLIDLGIVSDNEDFFTVNQMALIIWTYKNKGYRNNQMVMQIGQPEDMLLQDPPCLRTIDTRIQDGKLHFFIYFRSWDLWGGFPANLAGIQVLKEYMASEIGVDDGDMVISSKGLHMYKYVWELAEILRGKTIDEFRNEFIED